MRLSKSGIGTMRVNNLDEMYPAQDMLLQSGQLVQYGTVKIQHKQKPIYDIDDSGSNDFYYGWIYMPITDNTQAFGLTQNQLVPREDLMDVTKKSVVSNVVQQNAKQNPMRVTME